MTLSPTDTTVTIEKTPHGILTLWSQGKDTYDIAKELRLPEAYVYNVLARHRGETAPPVRRGRAA